jgi:hypothetical protein
MPVLKRIIGVFVAMGILAGPSSAEINIEYNVIVKGSCKFQMVKGWFPCHNAAVYTLFKNGRYLYQFFDKQNDVFAFAGGKDRQPDIRNLYSNIDTIRATIRGEQVVDQNAMGECHMNVSPAADTVYYIDCDVFNSKRSVFFQFRMRNITEFKRACGNELRECQ